MLAALHRCSVDSNRFRRKPGLTRIRVKRFEIANGYGSRFALKTI